MPKVYGSEIEVTPEAALLMLKESTSHHGVYIDLDRAIQAYSAAHELLRPIQEAMRKMSDDPLLTPDSRSYTQIYIERFGVPSYLMIQKGAPSAAKGVIQNLLVNDKVPETAKTFAKLHLAAAGYNTIRKSMKSYMYSPILSVESFEGHRIVRVRPEYHILSTGRLQARDPNVQNIARAFPDLITYLGDWELLRCDSGQIEPRIMYSHYIKDQLIFELIRLYDDAYFGLLHFITMTPREEASMRANPSLLEKKPFTQEERQELKLAGLAAGYGSNLEGKDVPYAQVYVEKINNHPLRKQWEAKVREYVRNGGGSFHTAFGYTITPEETQTYKKTSPGWVDHVVRCGINNPIQGTASQLMCVAVEEAYKILVGRKSKMCYFKHDEGAFYIHKSERALIDELKECTSYDVTYVNPKTKEETKWLPIKADFILGKKEGSGFGLATLLEEAKKDISGLVEEAS